MLDEVDEVLGRLGIEWQRSTDSPRRAMRLPSASASRSARASRFRVQRAPAPTKKKGQLLATVYAKLTSPLALTKSLLWRK